MKFLGICLLLGAGTLAGMQLSKRLWERVLTLREIRELLERFSGELRFKRTPTGQLLREAAADPGFQRLSFLKKAAERFDGREPVFFVWEQALKAGKIPSGSPEGEILREMGRTLGASDRDSQLAAFALLSERMDGILLTETSRAEREGKLCRSLGILGGLFLAVLAL